MQLEKQRQSLLLPVFFFILLILVLFWNFLTGSAVLLTTDAAISSASKPVADVLRATYANCNSGVLLGETYGFTGIAIACLLQAIMSGVIWNNLVYGLACLAASLVFLIGFGRQLNRWAVVCGALTAFWLGSNFTLLYAGHDFKPYVVLFFVCALWSAGIVSWRGGILWGGFTGLMFAQQQDVGLFFALFAGAHLIFRLWRREGLTPLRWLPVLIPAAVMALLFAAGPLLNGYKIAVKDTVQVQNDTPQEKWEYVTQWSFPPEESIDFIAPGYTGWRSGEPDGPYWGRMGRSPGWERTRQGYMNFKLESVYLGFIPLAFALFALFSVLARGKCGSATSTRAEILFWGAAAAVALLMAFGKFFPLYALFYQLPIVSNIRNPNKFLQVFQVALAILTAYGVDALFEARSQKSEVRSQKAEDGLPCEALAKQGRQTPDARRQAEVREQRTEVNGQRLEVRGFFWCLLGVLGVLGLWALGQTFGRGADVAQFVAKGWPPEIAGVMAQNKVNALWYALLMAAVTAAVFAVFSFDRMQKLRRYGVGLAVGLVLLVAADAIKLSRHYMQDMPRSYIQANALTDFLKKNIGVQRVALLTQQSIYNIWLTYLLPYNQIPAFNLSQMPRMANDYKNLLTAGSKNPLRMWRFAAVKYLLGPAAFEKQLPAGQIKKVFAYNLAAAPDNEFQVIPDPNGAHAVFELLDTVPRYALVTGFEPASDEQALARIAGNGPLLSGQGQPGTAEVRRYRPGHVELKTQSDAPAMLRVAERWNPDWKAEVDGQPVEVQRIDYLCQGVALSAGAHDITLAYSPSRLFFYMQCAGCLALLAALFWKRYGNRSH